MAWADRLNRQGYRGDGPRFGGRLRMMSVVTWLIIVNAGLFVIDGILSSSMRAATISPGHWFTFSVDQAIGGLQVWRFVTYTFIHGGLFHIFFNMLALYYFGPMVEAELGGRRFAAFYLLCGIAGSALFTLLVFALPGVMFPAGSAATLAQLFGASGCVMGVLIGAAMIAPDQQVMLLIPPIPMKLRTLAIAFIGLDFLTVLVGGANAGGSVAHLGGAGFGWLLFQHRDWLNFANRDFGGQWRQRRNEHLQRKQDELEREVDRILAKVSGNGLQSLTEREKRTLKKATESRRGGGSGFGGGGN